MNDTPPQKESLPSALSQAWFNLLGWVALIAGVQILNAKRHSLLLQVIIFVSLLFILQYFMALADRLRLPWLTSRPILHRVITTLIGTGVAWGAYFLAQRAIFLFAELGQP